MTYGTTGSADYYFQATGRATLSPSTGVPTSVTIPAGQSEAVVDIVTRADNVTEQDLVRIQLAGSTQADPPAHWYAMATRDPLDVLIYDGPEWTIHELEANDAYSIVSSSAAAVNSGTFLTSGGWDFRPQVAGISTVIPSPGGPVTSWGAWWNAGVPGAYNISGSFIPTGISQRPNATTPSILVGNWGTAAYRFLDNGSGYTSLKNLAVNNGVSAVFGINPAGTWYAGRRRKAGVDRPVYWNNAALNNLPVDLAGNINAAQFGTAFAVNNAGAVVVEFQMSEQSESTMILINRGFRIPAISQTTNQSVDKLLPIGEEAGFPLATSAIAIASDLAAVGSLTILGSGKQVISWTPNSQIGVRLGYWKPVYQGPPDIESEAKGINSSGWIVGRSQPSTGYSRVVFRRSSAAETTPPPWIDLNDRPCRLRIERMGFIHSRCH